MKIVIPAIMATLLLLIFFPTQDDLTKDYSFYYQSSKVKQVSTVISGFDLADGKPNPNVTNKVWNEDKKMFEDVPVTDKPKSNTPDYGEPATAYMMIIDKEQEWWTLENPPNTGANTDYDGRFGNGYIADGYYHTGWDIQQKVSYSPIVKETGHGGEISSVKPGYVVHTENVSLTTQKAGYATHVVVAHFDKTTTMYAHMIYDSIQVKEGDLVQAGTVLGQMGSTGNSTFVHVHFESRANPSVMSTLANPDATNTAAWYAASTGQGSLSIDVTKWMKSLQIPAFTRQAKPTSMAETEVPAEVWTIWKARE